MNDLKRQAARLEELLPLLMRSIYRADGEPLSDLPLGQLRVVRVLFEGSRTPSELAHELGLTHGAITQLVQRLEDSGLIQRSTSAEDRRIRHIALSPIARSQMCLRRELRRKQAEEALNRLEPAIRLRAIEALEALVASAIPEPVA